MRKLSDFTDQYLELFTRLAVKYNINIIGGSHLTVEDGNLFNISYLFRAQRQHRQTVQAAYYSDPSGIAGVFRAETR